MPESLAMLTRKHDCNTVVPDGGKGGSKSKLTRYESTDKTKNQNEELVVEDVELNDMQKRKFTRF